MVVVTLFLAIEASIKTAYSGISSARGLCCFKGWMVITNRVFAFLLQSMAPTGLIFDFLLFGDMVLIC